MGKEICLDSRNKKICGYPSEIYVIIFAVVDIISGLLALGGLAIIITFKLEGLIYNNELNESSSVKDAKDGDMAATIICILLTLGQGVLLFVGVRKRSAQLLQVWVIVKVIHLVVAVLSLVIIKVVFYRLEHKKIQNTKYTHSKESDETVFGALISRVLLILALIGLNVYLILCVKQFRNELLENKGVYIKPSQALDSYRSPSQNDNDTSSTPSSQQGFNSPSWVVEPV